MRENNRRKKEKSLISDLKRLGNLLERAVCFIVNAVRPLFRVFDFVWW